jgi:hypothetical protein
VVEGGLFPVVRGVTGGAVSSKLTIVGIVSLVAGVAVLWRTTIDTVDVAVLAGDASVLAQQGKGGLGVVEGGLFPILWGVAGGAVGPKLTTVGIVGLVAGVAVLWCRLQGGRSKGKVSRSWSNCWP